MLEPVNILAVIADAARLMDRRLKDEQIALQLPQVQGPVMVIGGPVRLQQVIVNLMTNAADAMIDSPNKTLILTLEQTTEWVILNVADTGPGLEAPDRVFEPFYTTKDIGASKGLGLGLSISYGIIGSFGGALSCRNTSNGAEFSVQLKVSK